MIDETWYDYFMGIILERYPKKSRLAKELMSLLNIEREAVYRRLRKEVDFSVHEVVKIAAAWNISLDEVMGIESGKITFTMKPINYLEPSEKDFQDLQKRVQLLEHLKTTPGSEYMDVCNKLPRTLLAGYPTLYQFDIFQWTYEYGQENGSTPFSKVVMTKEFSDLIAHFYQLMKHTENMNYIWDNKIFEYLVRNIKYFHSILLISDEDKGQIKTELLSLLDYLSEVAVKGYFPETKKKANIYISKSNIDTNYSYVYTSSLKVCRIHVFGKYDIFTYDEKMVNDFREWMLRKKRTSIQISEVDEKSRLEFFMKQQQLIESL